MSARLVIELKILPIDTKGIGVTTYGDAAKALRALAEDFEAEAPGAELALADEKYPSGEVFHSNGDSVGTWRVR